MTNPRHQAWEACTLPTELCPHSLNYGEDIPITCQSQGLFEIFIFPAPTRTSQKTSYPRQPPSVPIAGTHRTDDLKYASILLAMFNSFYEELNILTFNGDKNIILMIISKELGIRRTSISVQKRVRLHMKSQLPRTSAMEFH